VSNGRVLFADFGLSFNYTDASGSTTEGMADGLTPRYCAPEVARHEARNTKSDIWCLGIVFLEMIMTLKGETTDYMDDFFSQHGTSDIYIRLNAAALPHFITHVATLGQRVDNLPLKWAEAMLCEAQADRPSASALATSIAAPGVEAGRGRFCGICCIAAAEDGFSDYASD
jgi:serine/threonine protein kinase